jgi:MFS transporter, OFA family, oxalate/formate antiporter
VTTLRQTRVFYGWWIVVTAFLNLFFVVGIIFYGFPVFYPSLVESLGFTRGQLIEGFLIGFALVGVLFGFLAGVLIDRVGSRSVILVGIGFVGVSLILLGSVQYLWQYYALCITEVLGYVLAGPIPNQVLIANWFTAKRGRAMGCAYLGLGLGGAVAPLLINSLIEHFGWRQTFQIVGAVILVVLWPIGLWITRSAPRDIGLRPDGSSEEPKLSKHSEDDLAAGGEVASAIQTRNFWLIIAGCTLVIGAIGTVIQHFILFLRDQGFSAETASQISGGLLISSLGGRVVVGYLADRFRKKNIMALFYAVVGLSIPLLYFAHLRGAVWTFAVIFGFAMGADYMLVPLITVECFGLKAAGKLLALIVMGYSLGQWGAPWLAGRLFDVYHSYDLAWGILAGAGMLGGLTIYAVSPHRNSREVLENLPADRP